MKPNQTLPSLLVLSCASLLGLSSPGDARAASNPLVSETADQAEKPEDLAGLDVKRLKELVTEMEHAQGGSGVVLTEEDVARLLKDSGMDAKKVDAMAPEARSDLFNVVAHDLADASRTAPSKDGASVKPEELFGLNLNRLRERVERDAARHQDDAGQVMISGARLTAITSGVVATWLKESGMDAKKVDAMSMEKQVKFVNMAQHPSLSRKSSPDESEPSKASAANLDGLDLPRLRARIKLEAAQQSDGKLTWNSSAARGWLQGNGMSAKRVAAMSDDEVKGVITEDGGGILAAPVPPGEFPASWTHDKKPATRAQHAALEGKPMPGLELTGWINGEVKPADMKGKVVLVDVYATWCGPCMAAIPHINELLKKYHDQGLVVVGVCASGSGQEEFAENAKAHGIQYPAAWDAQQKVERVWVAYYPTLAVVDRKGIVRAVGLGPDHIEEVVKKLLAEPAT